MLIKGLEMAYRKDANYAFDITPDPQKYRLIGCSLVGWTHGDMQGKNLGMWLQDRARKEYGQAKFAEVHAGHIHHEQVKEKYLLKLIEDTVVYQDGGIAVKHLPTISNSSFWEHQQGYPQGVKSMACFVWSETQGLRETWYSNL
jgi:hypothetical protein